MEVVVSLSLGLEAEPGRADSGMNNFTLLELSPYRSKLSMSYHEELVNNSVHSILMCKEKGDSESP